MMVYLPTFITLFFCSLSSSIIVSSSSLHDPDLVVQQVHRSINESISRRNLGYLSCRTGNPIDDCWRCDTKQLMVEETVSTLPQDPVSTFTTNRIWIDHCSFMVSTFMIVRKEVAHKGGDWQASDGDAVAIFGGKNIWIDHCSLSSCEDGLIDAIHGSTAITISNNYFTHHDKVMLLRIWFIVNANHNFYSIGSVAPMCASFVEKV